MRKKQLNVEVLRKTVQSRLEHANEELKRIEEQQITNENLKKKGQATGMSIAYDNVLFLLDYLEGK